MIKAGILQSGANPHDACEHLFTNAVHKEHAEPIDELFANHVLVENQMGRIVDVWANHLDVPMVERSHVGYSLTNEKCS